MSAYTDQLRASGQFDAVRAKILSGEIALCPNCWGEGETMEWYIDQDTNTVIYEYPPCELCAHGRVAAVAHEQAPF